MILNPGVQMRGWGINRNHLESRRLQGRMLNAGDGLDQSPAMRLIVWLSVNTPVTSTTHVSTRE